MKRPQFTLIELLVVIAIIAILASMLLPALGRAKEQSKNATCQGQLHTFGLAINLYGNDYQDWLPPYHSSLRIAYFGNDWMNAVAADTAPYTWVGHGILFHLDYIAGGFRKTYYCPANGVENAFFYRDLPELMEAWCSKPTNYDYIGALYHLTPGAENSVIKRSRLSDPSGKMIMSDERVFSVAAHPPNNVNILYLGGDVASFSISPAMGREWDWSVADRP